jgi:hypothetical protein
VMRDASICGLGQTAPAAVTSALQLGLLDAPPRRSGVEPRAPHSMTPQDPGSRNGRVPH